MQKITFRLEQTNATVPVSPQPTKFEVLVKSDFFQAILRVVVSCSTFNIDINGGFVAPI
jgi:hypothetical protein